MQATTVLGNITASVDDGVVDLNPLIPLLMVAVLIGALIGAVGVTYLRDRRITVRAGQPARPDRAAAAATPFPSQV